MTFSGKSQSGLQQTIPALLINMSTLPNSSFNFLAASNTFSRFDISTTYPLHGIPSDSSSSIVLLIAITRKIKSRKHLLYLWYHMISLEKAKVCMKRPNSMQIYVK